MTRILFPAIMILLLITSEVNAQDPHFSQFYMSPLTLNPAVTGMFNAKARFTANYRNQWASVTVPYQTFSASGEGSFFREQLGGDYAGFGLIALNDVAGDSKFRSTQIGLSAAYHKSLDAEDSQFLSAGVQIGGVQRTLDFTKLFFDSQYDGSTLNGNIGSGENLSRDAFWYFDVSAGLNWYLVPDDRNNFHAGVSVFHINQPNQSLYGSSTEQLYRKFCVHAGGEFGLNDRYAFVPQVIYLHQGSANELNVSAQLRIKLGDIAFYDESTKALNVGLMYRVKDAVVITTRFDFGPFSVGASYDMNTSSLYRASNYFGGPEVSLMYRLGLEDDNFGRVKCPSF